MSLCKFPAIPFPAGVDQNLIRVLSPIKETLDMMAGRIGNDELCRMVTVEDLLEGISINIGAPGGGTSDHGALTGLADDDHVQYLLIDGTRAMTGTLDMGDNNIDVGAGQIIGDNRGYMTIPSGFYGFRYDDPVTSEAFRMSVSGSVLYIDTQHTAKSSRIVWRAQNASGTGLAQMECDGTAGVTMYHGGAERAATTSTALRASNYFQIGTGQQVNEIVTSISGASTDDQLATALAVYNEVSTEIATHAAAADPHTVYQLESEKGAANGYAGLDASSFVPTANLGSGTADSTTYLRGDQTWQTAGGAFTEDGTSFTLYGGTGAGTNLTTGAQYNFLAGYNAGYTLSAGDYNVAIGYQANYYGDTGGNNTAVGYNVLFGDSAAATKDWAGNTAIGFNCMYNATDGAIGNTAIGYQSLYGEATTKLSANGNVAVGYYSMEDATNDFACVAIGYEAMRYVRGGDYSVAIGYRVGRGDSVGGTSNSQWNVFIGSEAGYAITTTNNAVAIGRQALYEATTGAGNTIAIGQFAAQYNTGGPNVAIGQQALQGSTGASSGNNNVAVGPNTLSDITTGTSNVGIGSAVFQNCATNRGNIGIGATVGVYQVGNGTVGGNVAIGYNCFWGVSAATNNSYRNVVIGEDSGRNMDSCFNNVVIGYGAGYYGETIDYNIYLGHYAGRGLSTGTFTTQDNNIAIGRQALEDIDTCAGSVAIGAFALADKQTENYSIAIGYAAGRYATDGTGHIYIGFNAGAGPSSGGTFGNDYNVAIGYNAGMDIDTGQYSVSIGYQAGQNQSDGDNNVFIGRQAGFGPISGGTHTATDGNIGIGYNALYDLDTGQYNVAVGANAAENITTADDCIAIGHYALQDATVGSYNIAIGRFAGGNGTGSSFASNIFVGASAGYGQGATVNTANGNVCIGRESAQYIDDANYNVAVGMYSLRNIDSGDENVAIGYQAGDSITTGSRNIAIGYDMDVLSATGSDQFALGNGTYPFLRGDMANYQLAIYGSNGYLNFNTTLGSGGYGIRDNAGTMEYKDSGGSWTTFVSLSDLSLKKNISSYHVGMEFIEKLQPVSFQWKDDTAGDQYHCGLVAQDVKAIMDNLRIEWSGWYERPDGKQGIDYKLLVIPLINAVKRLQREVDELKRRK